MSISIVCPDCTTRLNVSHDPAGQIAVCPKCDCEIEIPADAAQSRSEDDERPRERKETQDRPRRRRSKPASGSSKTGVYIALGAGGAVLLAVAVAAVFLVRAANKEHAPKAGETARGDDASPAENWVDFRHPEGLFTVKVPAANPVHFGRPDGGTIFAPAKNQFHNSSTYVSLNRDLSATMEVSILTPLGMDHEKSVDKNSAIGKSTARRSGRK